MLNNLYIILNLEKKESREYFSLEVVLNNKKIILRMDEDSEITKFSSFKKDLLEYFSKDILFFIVENYKKEDGIRIDKLSNSEYFQATGAKNYLKNLKALIVKVLLKQNSYTMKIKNDIEYLTIEKVILNSKFSDYQELFNYEFIEDKYPEYYI